LIEWAVGREIWTSTSAPIDRERPWLVPNPVFAGEVTEISRWAGRVLALPAHLSAVGHHVSEVGSL